jgi:hypothetical protein
MKKSWLIFAIAIVAVVLFSGCADVSAVCPAPTDHIYGFWGGLWHGLIIFWSWIGSLFSDDIAVYAVSNNGGWYDFGFLLGAGMLASGSTTAATR